jgi:hypothetical protein
MTTLLLLPTFFVIGYFAAYVVDPKKRVSAVSFEMLVEMHLLETPKDAGK